jgi:hypothetical protein
VRALCLLLLLLWVMMERPTARCLLLNQALRSNKRIDGLYLYIGTSTPEVLAQRQKQRLAEAASTQAKKLAWAKQQLSKSSTAGLFDNVIPNTSLDEVSSRCTGHWHTQPAPLSAWQQICCTGTTAALLQMQQQRRNRVLLCKCSASTAKLARLLSQAAGHAERPASHFCSQAYAALKEAISKLSPIIRNRLRGLPAYVLDYSDLIPPNR